MRQWSSASHSRPMRRSISANKTSPHASTPSFRSWRSTGSRRRRARATPCTVKLPVLFCFAPTWRPRYIAKRFSILFIPVTRNTERKGKRLPSDFFHHFFCDSLGRSSFFTLDAKLFPRKNFRRGGWKIVLRWKVLQFRGEWRKRTRRMTRRSCTVPHCSCTFPILRFSFPSSCSSPPPSCPSRMTALASLITATKINKFTVYLIEWFYLKMYKKRKQKTKKFKFKKLKN